MSPPPDGRSEGHEAGVGATEALSLRVSVAALVRVLFASPEDGRTMLVLERTATLGAGDGRPGVSVAAKPFGGGVRILDPEALREAIGDFQFDSERSRREGDFRLQIQPGSWEEVKSVCRAHLGKKGGGILDPSPDRELAEEFGDALGLTLDRSQYRSAPLGMLTDDEPRRTTSLRAPGRPTVRVYYLFEAWLQAPEILVAALESSRRRSDQDLRTAALEEAREGGRGRANAALVLGLEEFGARYFSLPEKRHGRPFRLEGRRFAGNVSIILEGIGHPGLEPYEQRAG